MLFIKSAATLALATGFAAAKPISSHSHSHSHAHSRRSTSLKTPRTLGSDFNFLDGFNQLNNQAQVLQIQEQNLQIAVDDDGFQQAIVQQARDVLIVNEQANGFNNQLNNLFRKSSFRNQFPDQSTALMVVREVQVEVDDGLGLGGVVEQSVFAQSVVVANRGLASTQTVMVVAETLIARDILGADFTNAAFAGATQVFKPEAAAFPTATADIQLFAAKPTWSSVVADPAATLGAVWQAELDDLRDVAFDGADNGLNAQLAFEEKKRLDELLKAEEEQKLAEEQAPEETEIAAH